MEIKILPYIEQDGIRTLRDSEVMGLFDRMEAEGRLDIVFYSGEIRDREDFLHIMKHGENRLMALMADGEPAGFCWLNRFQNHTAQVHFCFFDGYRGRSAVEIGRYALQRLISFKDREGNYIYDAFLGYLPVFNRPGIEFVRQCGAKVLGVVPNAVWVAARQRSEDAAAIYYVRGDDHEDL